MVKLYQKAELESLGKQENTSSDENIYTPRALCGSNGAVYERVTLPGRFDTFRYLPLGTCRQLGSPRTTCPDTDQ